MTAYINLPGECVACGAWVADKPSHTVTCLPMRVALDDSYNPSKADLAATPPPKTGKGYRLACDERGRKLCRCGQPVYYDNECKPCHNRRIRNYRLRNGEVKQPRGPNGHFRRYPKRQAVTP
jgi:hypothetical protein